MEETNIATDAQGTPIVSENEATESIVSEEKPQGNTILSTDEKLPIDDTAEGVDEIKEKPSVPEEYEDFTAPEGLVYDPEASQEFKSVAKELGLTQEAAQKLADMYGSKMVAQQEQQKQQVDQWFKESTKTYKPVEIELAKKTLGRFADRDFMELLDSSGLGNHPKMVGLFKTIGSQISEGKYIDAGAAPKVSPLFKNSPDMYK